MNWLAKSLQKEHQSIFLIEKIQPNWFKNSAEITFYKITSGVISGLIAWFIFGLLFGISVWFNRLYNAAMEGYKEFLFELYSVFIVSLIFGIFILILEILIVFFMPKIKPIDNLKWSNIKFKKNILKGLVIGSMIGLVLGIFIFSINALLFAPILSELISLVISGLILGLNLGLLYAIIEGFKGVEIDSQKIMPNQGIRKSALNALTLGIIAGIVAIFLYILIQSVSYIFFRDNNSINTFFLFFTAILCLIIGLFSGGVNAVVKHIILRSMLYQKGFSPWNYARFLNYATERLFIQKVGGGYIFIHRMLMEHFANMKLNLLSSNRH